MSQVLNVKFSSSDSLSESHLEEKSLIFLSERTKASHQRYMLFPVIPPRLRTEQFSSLLPADASVNQCFEYPRTSWSSNSGWVDSSYLSMVDS